MEQVERVEQRVNNQHLPTCKAAVSCKFATE